MLKVAVFGAGAVGGLIGAHLARQIQQGVGRVQLTLFARGGATARATTTAPLFVSFRTHSIRLDSFAWRSFAFCFA